MTPTKLANAVAEILEGYANGTSLAQLAVLHGVSTGTVRNLLIAEGIVRRARGRQPKVTAPETTEAE